MLVIEKEFQIEAPAEVVWEVLTDLPRYREWNPFVLECSSTLKPGEPIRMSVNLGGKKPQPVDEVMLEFVPGRRFAYHMRPFPLGALSSLRSHDVERVGPGTSRYRSYFELKGWLRPLVALLMGGNLRRGFAGMTEALGRRAEDLWAQRRQKPAA